MQWDELSVGGVVLLLLVACELAALVALVAILAARGRRKRREALGRVRGFEIKPKQNGAPGDASGMDL
jgi:hypothetical protein